MNKRKKRKSYIGSVRFYKHLILTTVFLAIVIPLTVSIVLARKNSSLKTEVDYWASKTVQLEKEMAEYEEELNSRMSMRTVKTEGQIVKSKKELFSETEEWQLILSNETHPLEEDFEVELAVVEGGQKVDKRILEDLNAMLSDMKKAGLRPVVCSGFRTMEKQNSLFQDYIKGKVRGGWSYHDAFYKAKTRIALPGTSEHQTGLAVDIVGKGHQSLDDAQADTKEAKWLAENSADYGFVLRYPKEKTIVTGIDYESWHFRYVGKEAAAYLTEKGLTLEEIVSELER